MGVHRMELYFLKNILYQWGTQERKHFCKKYIFINGDTQDRKPNFLKNKFSYIYQWGYTCNENLIL